MHAASFWRIAAPLLAIAAVNPAADPADRAAAKPPARPQPNAAADDPFGTTAPDPFAPAKLPSAKAKQTAKEPVATAPPLDPALCYWPRRTVGEANVESALDKPTPPIEFTETPLKDVVDYLKGSAHIEIQLDAAGMKDARIDPEQQVTKSIRGVSLASALDILLVDTGLAWEIHHEVLWITSPKRVAEHRTTRLYVVSDLVPAGGKDGKPQDDYATLIELITATVAPGSWEGKGATGSIKGATLGGPKVLCLSLNKSGADKLVLEAAAEPCWAKVLSVSATYQVHRELTEYLASIRRIRMGGGAAHDLHDVR